MNNFSNPPNKLKRVIVIDDDSIDNFITIKLITKLNIAETIEVKKNGLEGINFIKETYRQDSPFCPTLLILDNFMPVMDGIEFMKELNQLHYINKDQFVILLLAATVRPTELKTYVANGIKEYTTKPLDEETIRMVYSKYWNKEGEWIGNNKK